MENESTPDNLQVLRFCDLVARRLVNNRMTLRRWVAKGLFPRPIRLSENTICWRLKDVEAWLDRKAKAGSGTAA